MQVDSAVNEDRRADGLLIYRGLDGWIILPADERPAIDRCPCCNRFLLSLDDAKLVAGRTFPP